MGSDGDLRGSQSKYIRFVSETSERADFNKLAFLREIYLYRTSIICYMKLSQKAAMNMTLQEDLVSINLGRLTCSEHPLLWRRQLESEICFDPHSQFLVRLQ